MEQICDQFGISRQAHYQLVHREAALQSQHEEVLNMVHLIRSQHPRMGVRKLLDKIQPETTEMGLKIGRDALFELLREHKMLVSPRKARYRTTIPGLYRTPNLLPGLTIERPNQVWVGDITYIAVGVDSFVFLFLLMDLYSHFIVGWHIAPSLASEGAIKSLEMALLYLPKTEQSLIHHSDHGCQYTSGAYMQILLAHQIRASMGEIGNCYDNIFAERLNGTLKNEYLLGDRFVHSSQVKLATQQAIQAYNYDRPHLSLDFAAPADVHFGYNVSVPPVTFPKKAG